MSRWCIAAKVIHNHVKYWIKPNIENRIKSGEVKAYFRSTVKQIERDWVCWRRPRATCG